jgi:hypothetical protein
VRPQINQLPVHDVGLHYHGGMKRELGLAGMGRWAVTVHK